MARHHQSVVGVTHASPAWPLPLMRTVLVVFGPILLVAGSMAVDSPPMSTAGHSLKTQGVVRMPPESLPLATIAARLPQTTWIANAQFASAPSHSDHSFASDERLSSPTVPLEQRDLRQVLLAMSAAQHTGHWISACPCQTRQIAYPGKPYDPPTSGPR